MKAADPLRRDLKDYYGGNKWMSGKNVALILIKAAGNEVNVQIFNSRGH